MGTAIMEVRSRAQFAATLNLQHIRRPREDRERLDQLTVLHMLMRDPSSLIGGILTPRMFFRLWVTAEVSADVCRDGMPEFQQRVPISRDDAYYGIHLLSDVPISEIPEQVYKSYAMGWQQQLKAIGRVMDRGVLPTEDVVQEELSYMDNRYNDYYRSNGGCLRHGLLAVIQTARDQSRSEGDGDFEECHGEELEENPAMEILDDDYLFVQHFLISYCITPGARMSTVSAASAEPLQAGPSGLGGANKRPKEQTR